MDADYGPWYEASYPRLTGAGLWLRGGELNTLPPAEYQLRALRVLFVRLSTYYDTAASFTHQLLYQLAADTAGVFPDLAYLPPRDDRPLMHEAGVPWLLGTQSKRGPRDFDLVGLSLSIVQELLNLPALLRESALPLGKRERMQDESVPLLLLGGASALYSSVLWTADALVDAIFVGESTEAIRRILELCRESKRAGQSKRELLEQLQSIDGLLEPDRPRATCKARQLDPARAAADALVRGPVAPLRETLGAAHLQLDEGCSHFCSFCAESWDRKPYRPRAADALLATALSAKATMGLELLELHSANFNAHPQLYELLWELAPYFGRIGLKSQRFDLLAHDAAALPIQQSIGKSSLTCGLEGISPRLRRYLHKNLDDEVLHAALRSLFALRPRELKVFLIATGLEQPPDHAAFDELLDLLRATWGAGGRGTRVIVSITPLVRFPWTPLEFEDAWPLEHYRPIIEQVATSVRRAGFEFRASAELSDYWVSQVLVRADDVRIERALCEALTATGFLYDRQITADFQQAFAARLRQQGLQPDELLDGAAEDASKPWTLVETGVARSFLVAEAARARAFVESDNCLGRRWSKAHCARCGACPTPEHITALVTSRQPRAYSPEQFKARLRARPADVPQALLVQVGPAARGLPRKALAVAVARALMLTLPELVPHYRRSGRCHFELDGQPVWLEGDDVLTLLWHPAALPVLAAAAADPSLRERVTTALGAWGSWLGLAPDGWQPARIELRSPYPLAVERYLRPRALKHTLRRNDPAANDGCVASDGSVASSAYRLELARDSLKKGILVALEWRNLSDGRTDVTIVPGPKFEPQAFLAEAFDLPEAAAWVRIRATVYGNAAP